MFMHLIGIVSLLVCMVLEKTMSVVTFGRYRPRRKPKKSKGLFCQSDPSHRQCPVRDRFAHSMHGSVP